MRHLEQFGSAMRPASERGTSETVRSVALNARVATAGVQGVGATKRAWIE